MRPTQAAVVEVQQPFGRYQVDRHVSHGQYRRRPDRRIDDAVRPELDQVATPRTDDMLRRQERARFAEGGLDLGLVTTHALIVTDKVIAMRGTRQGFIPNHEARVPPKCRSYRRGWHGDNDHVGTDGTGAGKDHRERILVIAVVVFAAAAAVTGVLIAAAHPRSGHQHSVGYVVIFAAVAAAVVAAMVWWMFRLINQRPAMKRVRRWSFADRRATARAVQKRQPLTAEQQRVAQAQLEVLNSNGRTYWIVLPIAVIAFGINAVINAGGLRPLWIVLAAMELVWVPAFMLLRRAQVRRFERALSASASGT